MEKLQLNQADRESIRLYNRIFRKNGGLSFRWADEMYQLFLLPRQPAYAPTFELAIGAGDHLFQLGFDHIFFADRLNGFLDGDDYFQLPDNLKAAVLEAVFEDLLSRFDAWSGL